MGNNSNNKKKRDIKSKIVERRASKGRRARWAITETARQGLVDSEMRKEKTPHWYSSLFSSSEVVAVEA